jgi:hypothetical protein
MVVLIPSYKRTEILHWVIRSVVNCDIQGIDERVLILVVNNYYPNKAVVDSILAQYRFEGNLEYLVLHREKTLPAVESWFSAMFTIAQEDEVVVLLGDDDILLPWGLKNRYHQIRETQADMLLSDFYQRLYFFQGGEKCWLNCEMPKPPIPNLAAIPWDYLPAKHPEASFISNHCYRNTEAFCKGFETAMSWCKAQDWVPIEYATGILPFYMAYATKSSGGVVVSLHEKCVVRGSVADEAMYQDYSDGGNMSFYSLLIYDTFSNKNLHCDVTIFDALHRVYRRAFFSGLLSILTNKRIHLSVLLKTMRHSGIQFRDFGARESLLNIQAIVRMIPGLRGYRLGKREKMNILQSTSELIGFLLTGK